MYTKTSVRLDGFIKLNGHLQIHLDARCTEFDGKLY